MFYWLFLIDTPGRPEKRPCWRKANVSKYEAWQEIKAEYAPDDKLFYGGKLYRGEGYSDSQSLWMKDMAIINKLARAANDWFYICKDGIPDWYKFWNKFKNAKLEANNWFNKTRELDILRDSSFLDTAYTHEKLSIDVLRRYRHKIETPSFKIPYL